MENLELVNVAPIQILKISWKEGLIETKEKTEIFLLHGDDGSLTTLDGKPVDEEFQKFFIEQMEEQQRQLAQRILVARPNINPNILNLG